MGIPTVTFALAYLICLGQPLIFFMTYAYISYVISSAITDTSWVTCEDSLLGHKVNIRASLQKILIENSNVGLY